MGKALELIDSNIEKSSIFSDAMHCILVSFLCVQQCTEDRHTIPYVVLMLGSENELAKLKEPGFFPRKDSIEAKSCSSHKKMSSTNEIDHYLARS